MYVILIASMIKEFNCIWLITVGTKSQFLATYIFVPTTATLLMYRYWHIILI